MDSFLNETKELSWNYIIGTIKLLPVLLNLKGHVHTTAKMLRRGTAQSDFIAFGKNKKKEAN